VIRIEWNSLRVGHHVLVHDDTEHDMPLVAGQVTMLKTAPRSNEVTIRISPVGEASRIVHPPRLAVHLDGFDRPQDCWRCSTDVNTLGRLQRNDPPASSKPAAITSP
jgi:hypothetical protein